MMDCQSSCFASWAYGKKTRGLSTMLPLHPSNGGRGSGTHVLHAIVVGAFDHASSRKHERGERRGLEVHHLSLDDDHFPRFVHGPRALKGGYNFSVFLTVQNVQWVSLCQPIRCSCVFLLAREESLRKGGGLRKEGEGGGRGGVGVGGGGWGSFSLYWNVHLYVNLVIHERSLSVPLSK